MNIETKIASLDSAEVKSDNQCLSVKSALPVTPVSTANRFDVLSNNNNNNEDNSSISSSSNQRSVKKVIDSYNLLSGPTGNHDNAVSPVSSRATRATANAIQSTTS